jgi:divalent metal cation (Fe/Co/Zn/Cd) transporter
MIENLFYFLYWFYTKSKAVKNPALHSFVDICVIIGFNITTLSILIPHFLGISLAQRYNDGGFFGLLIGIIIMILNYFTWYNKRQIIIFKYKQMPRKEKVRKSIFSIIYIVLSLLCFYFSAKAFLPWW